MGIGTTSPADSINIQQTNSVIRFKNTGASNVEGIELYNPTTGNLVASYGSFGNTENGYIQDATGNNVIFNSTSWLFNRVVRISDNAGGYGFHHQNNTRRTGFGGILGSAAKAAIHISGSGNNIGLYSEGFISGSAQSTGSFGQAYVDKILRVAAASNADQEGRIEIGGYDTPMIEFKTHNGWGRQRIQGHYGGGLTMYNSGSVQKDIELVLGLTGTSGVRGGSLHIATEQMDAIGMSTAGYDTAQYGTITGSAHWKGNAVISARHGTGGSDFHRLHFTNTNILSGSSTSTGSFGRLEVSHDGGLQIGNTIKSFYELSGWGLRIQRAASTGFAIKLFPGSGYSYAFIDLLGGAGIFKLDGTEKFRLDSTGINVTSGNVSD